MDIATELRDGDPQAESFFEILYITTQKMIWLRITSMNAGVVHVDDLDPGRPFAESSDVRVVLPQRVGGGSDVDLELSRIGRMKITRDSGKHSGVTGTLSRSKN